MKKHIFQCPSGVFDSGGHFLSTDELYCIFQTTTKEVLQCSIRTFGAIIKAALLPKLKSQMFSSVFMRKNWAFRQMCKRELQDEFTFEKYLLLFLCCAVSALARFLYDFCRDFPPVAALALSGSMFALSAATGRNVRQYGTALQEQMINIYLSGIQF